FRGAAEHRENRAVFEKVDGVISPLAGCDLPSIQIENTIELATAECHLTYGGWCSAYRGTTPEGLAGVNFAGTERHAAPPLLWLTMIAPAAMDGKHFLLVPNGQKIVQNRPLNDHEVVNPSHNNAQFRSIAGHAALGSRQRCLKARSGTRAGFLRPPAPRGSIGRAS